MTRYLVIASLRRGSVNPAEPVSEDTQARMQEQDRIDALPHLPRCDPFENQRVHWRVSESGIPVYIPQHRYFKNSAAKYVA